MFRYKFLDSFCVLLLVATFVQQASAQSEHRPKAPSDHKPKAESDHKPKAESDRKRKSESEHKPKAATEHKHKAPPAPKPVPQPNPQPIPQPIPTIQPQPDLVVSDVKITSVSGSQVEYSYRITNRGQSSANLSGVVASAALSADEHSDAADLRAGSHTLSGTLAPGESIACSCAGLARINPPETPYLIVTVDTDNALAESDESNNAAHAILQSAFAKPEKLKQETTVVDQPYPTTEFLIKAPPSPTIIFEAPAPPTIVFLPQVATAPRIINLQPATAPRLIVIGGAANSHLQIPPYLLEYKPPCICIPIPGPSGTGK